MFDKRGVFEVGCWTQDRGETVGSALTRAVR